MAIKKVLIFTLCLWGISSANAQVQKNIWLNKAYSLQYDIIADSLNNRMCTAIKPYRFEEFKQLPLTHFNYSNLLNSKWGNKLFNQDLITMTQGSDYGLYLNPLFDFSLGYDIDNMHQTWTNTRGLQFTGFIGKKLSFNTNLYENQAVTLNYIDTFFTQSRVIPGQGRAKRFGTNGLDFPWAEGYLSYTTNKYFNVQLGNGKNFIGNGYRSLLLSDNSYVMPYLKLSTSVGKVKYINIFTEFNDFRGSNLAVDSLYSKKKAHIHYLDWSLTKRLNIGLFEAVVFTNGQAGLNRGFDFNYWNPIIYFRPVEHNIGSPDNVLIGANFNVKLNNSTSVYGQILLDEFSLNEIKSGNGWWGNKHGFQIGAKTHNLFNIRNLHALAEFNWVRPYTYSQRNSSLSYSHQGQPIAHPLGANFMESASLLNYNHRRWNFEVKYVWAKYGLDTDTAHYGKDIDKPYAQRSKEYGNFVGQGLVTQHHFLSASTGYMLNPRTNMRLVVGVNYRNFKNELSTQSNTQFFVSFVTSLNNFYYDF